VPRAGGTLVEPGDIAGAAAALDHVLHDPERWATASDHALQLAGRYTPQAAKERWLAYVDEISRGVVWRQTSDAAHSVIAKKNPC